MSAISEEGQTATYVFAIRAVEIKWAVERDMRVSDHTSVMKVVRTCDMGKKTMKQEDISLLRRHGRNLLALRDVIVVSAFNWWVQSFGMVIEILHETCRQLV